ncbi:MAG TPA: universal stress protein [Dehalococcoidia bacterium]|nr:universal stress protein [Dehalococcoidia bacterium]
MTTPTISRILVALDGSERGESVLPLVRKIAAATGATIILVRGIPELSTPNPEIVYQYIKEQSPKIRAYLGNMRRRLKAGGLTATTRQLHGAMAESIAALAQKERADLIAIATRGRSGVKRAILGSTATRIVRLAACPVLVLKHDEHGATQAPTFECVLVSLDGTQLAESILPATRALADLDSGTLVLCHHISGNDDLEEAQRYLHHTAETLRNQGASVESKLYRGSRAEAALAVAEEIDAGLIAVSTRGRSALGRILKGSAADEVLTQTNRPCLTINSSAEPA